MEQGASACDCDWSLLLPDLIALIHATLELPDLLNSTATCRSWLDAYKSDPHLDVSPLFRGPCLLVPSGGERDPPGTATLHSFSDGRAHRVTLPDPPFSTRYIAGSSHGWLATADDQSELILVNPVTRAQVKLPSIQTCINVTSSYEDGVLQSFHLHHVDVDPSMPWHNEEMESLSLRPDEGRFYFYEKVVFSSDPTSGNCIVLVKHARHNIFSFARVGDAKWDLLRAEKFCCDYQDFYYNEEDGLFYAIRGNGEVHTIDLNGPSPVVKVILKAIQSVGHAKYIVRAPWGDILQVSWDDEYIMGPDVRTSQMVVYRIDFVEQNIVQVKDLRGYALFIGFNSSFLFLPTDGCSMIKQNCVYHAADLIDIDDMSFSPHRVVQVNLEDGSINDLWPSPNSWSDLAPPVWLTPSCYPCRVKISKEV